MIRRKYSKGKKTTPPRLENIQFIKYVNYNYDDYEDYEDDDTYSYITRVWLEKAKLEWLARDITMNELDAYCALRIMTHFHWYDNEMWQFNVRTYYYGDEVFEAKPYNLAEVISTIDTCLALPINERIPFLLNLKYGYLLDVVKNRTWTIDTVNREDVHFGSQYHHTEPVERYSTYNLPIIVALDLPEGLTIIDGYHRFLSNTDTEISIIVGR